MSHRNYRLLAGLALALLLGAASIPLVKTPTTSAQSAGGVPRGTTTTFAILAGQAVTSTGLSVVNGDVGISPGTAITGFPPGA